VQIDPDAIGPVQAREGPQVADQAGRALDALPAAVEDGLQVFQDPIDVTFLAQLGEALAGFPIAQKPWMKFTGLLIS
jgi:hypothetical protein